MRGMREVGDRRCDTLSGMADVATASLTRLCLVLSSTCLKVANPHASLIERLVGLEEMVCSYAAAREQVVVVEV